MDFPRCWIDFLWYSLVFLRFSYIFNLEFHWFSWVLLCLSVTRRRARKRVRELRERFRARCRKRMLIFLCSSWWGSKLGNSGVSRGAELARLNYWFSVVFRMFSYTFNQTSLVFFCFSSISYMSNRFASIFFSYSLIFLEVRLNFFDIL